MHGHFSQETKDSRDIALVMAQIAAVPSRRVQRRFTDIHETQRLFDVADLDHVSKAQACKRL